LIPVGSRRYSGDDVRRHGLPSARSIAAATISRTCQREKPIADYGLLAILRAIINCIRRHMYRSALTAVLLVFAAPAFADDPRIAIGVRDHQFVPAEVPVPAGVKVELVIRNEQTSPAEFESSSLHREKIVPPGGQISVYVGPLDPGTYEIFDDFHRETRGRLVVR
jgi:hypothetical protein